MARDKTIRNTILGSMTAIIAVLVVLGYAGLYAAREQQQNLNLVSHTYNVKNNIDDLLDELRNATAGQRAYVVTGSEESLRAFEAAIDSVAQLLANLRFLVRDNPAQVTRTDELTALFNARFNEAYDVISLRRDGQAQAAYQKQLSGLSLSLTEAINHQTKQLSAEEDWLLSELGSTYLNAQWTKYLSVGGAGAAIIAVFLALFVVFRDTRQRDATERALRDSSSMLENALGLQRALIDSADYCIFTIGLDGMISEFNPAAEKLLGYRAHEVIGRAGPEIFLDPAESQMKAEKLSQELGTTVQPGPDLLMAKPLRGQGYEEEWTYIRKDRSRVSVMLSVSAIRSGEDIVSGFIAIASDITERKKVEQLKNEFISTVSHELRTPLTSIRGSLGLVLGGVAGELPAQAKILLDIAHKNAERLVRLINDILDIEKIESGKMEFQMKLQALSPLLQQALDGTADYGRQYGVSFRLADEAGGCEIDVDADRFMQIMANLLSNAAKYSPRDGVVDVKASRADGKVRISVSDRGTGIPEEFRSRIFGKFAQADSSDTRQKGGTGLGLSITKAMTERMNGAIHFDSVVGEGTTFHIELPIVAPAAPLESPIALTSRPAILIVEDDADIGLLLRIMLDKNGFDSEIVATADAAMAKLRETDYVAMTLDIALPDRSGLDLFREVRDDAKTSALPIIFISAEADKGRRELNGAAIGVLDWLQKPIDQDRLQQALSAIGKRPGEPARILHVEDDPDVAQVVAGIVGPLATLNSASTLHDARAKLAGGTHYDMVILDMTLPDGDGGEILADIPPHMPVVIFSAREMTEDVAQRVSVALTKSRASNEELLQSIASIIDKLVAPKHS